jgi:GR25 family glycosyltransferase involved in LPS biosynthesis
MKICFATEVTYPNYVNRIKVSSLKDFLDKKLYDFEISYYISTNMPNEFSEYESNEYIKVFDVENLRKENIKSKELELLPEDPTGLYPARYPWNLRRFIIEKAAIDGFDYVVYVDADNMFHGHISGEDIYKELLSRYEPNSVQTNSTIFKYVNKTPDDVFHYHKSYIEHFSLDFEDEQYDTIDGPCQVFIGKTNKDILRFISNWHNFTEFGYKKEFGYGYGNNKHGNLSFVIPISGFKLKWNSFPFYPNHVYDDRYTHENNHNTDIGIKSEKIIEKNSNESINNTAITDEQDTLTFFLKKYSSDKFASGYSIIYDKIFENFKKEKLKILEIGVGTISITPLENMSSVPGTMYGWKEKHPSYEPGSSLRAFRDYFPNSELFGIDIQPDCLIDEDRIKTFLVDSTNEEQSTKIFQNDFFDLIIDDGDHSLESRINTLHNFYPKLKNKGLYFIESVINLDKLISFLDKSELNYQILNDNILMIRRSNEPFNKLQEVTEQKVQQEYNFVDEIKLEFFNEDKEFKINGYKFADRGFFINLEKSKDRLKLVIDQINKYKIEGLNRFEALTDEMIQFSCTKSHLKVFENSLIDDFEIIFVAEDDFMIEDVCYHPKINNINFFDSISKIHHDLKNVEWDVLLFGCNPKAPLIPITDNLAVANKSTGAWAYLIKKKAYRFLLKNSNYKKDYIAIDDWLPLLNDNGFITLTTIPLTINHGVNLVSTLQPSGPVNYDGWIKGSYHKFLYDIYNFDKNDEFSLEKNITLVITGHFVENFTFYLNYLLHSLPDELKKCKILVNYDETNEKDIGFDKLKLESFFKDIKHSMNTSISYSKGGLISSIKNVLDKIKTPYFIFLEHDWVFLHKTEINFNKLIQVFNKHNFVNAIWFSKDDNQLRGFEICYDIDGTTTPFEREDRVNDCDLITSCRWSNNPAIFRLSKFKDWYDNIIKNEYVDIVNQAASNVEETMIPYYRNQIKELGWNTVKDNWGTYLYGKIGEGPYVGHTDASKRYQGHNKSQPEINGENYIKNNPL